MSVTQRPPVLAEGDRIADDYEVVALLSRSRLLDVYDVYSDSRDCRCVAKMARPDRVHDERTRRRLCDEGRLLLSFAHPHVVRAYELIEEPEPVLILETLSGETLEHALASTSQRPPPEDVAFLGLHLCSALHYMHGRGILHLDVKPTNVVVDGGTAKLLDLSAARPSGPIAAGAGSRRYMAPEQARGGDIGPPADVWGVGCVLYQAATGRPPLEVCEDGYDQLRRRAEPVAAGRTQLPRAIAAAIDAALEPEAEARPRVGELTNVLDAAIPG